MQSVKPRPPAWQVCSWLFGCTIPKTLSRKGRQARQEGWTAQVLLCDLRVHASGHAGGLVNLTSLGVRPAVRLSDPGGLGQPALPAPFRAFRVFRSLAVPLFRLFDPGGLGETALPVRCPIRVHPCLSVVGCTALSALWLIFSKIAQKWPKIAHFR